AAVRVDPADLRVGPSDGEDEQAHPADQPEAHSRGEKEGEAKDVEAAGSPVAEEQARGLKPTDIPRAFTGEQGKGGGLAPPILSREHVRSGSKNVRGATSVASSSRYRRMASGKCQNEGGRHQGNIKTPLGQSSLLKWVN